MKQSYFVFLRSVGCLCMAFFISACSKTDMDSVSKPKVFVPEVVTQLTYEQALKRALLAVESIDDVHTRSASRYVKSHELIKTDPSVVTRSSSLTSDSLMYIFNFEDDMGFAIIPSDPRTPNAIAMSAVGNFDAGSATSGDTMLMTLLEDYQIAALAANAPIVPGGDIKEPNPWWDDSRPTRSEYGEWLIDTQIGPMLETRWGQGAHGSNSSDAWNYYIENRYLAGCVTIATAQIMSYFRFPTHGGGFTYNWTDMFDDEYGIPCESTKRFIVHVYNNLPDKKHNSEGTGIHDRSVVYCLSALGYSDDGQEHGYDYERVINSLEGGSPVYTSGCAKREYVLGIPFDSKGHAWVVDGYIIKKQEVKVYQDGRVYQDGELPELLDTYYHSASYLHCNWGWGGKCDGYYTPGVFNTIEGPVDPDRDYGNTGNYHFSYDLKIRVNIKP